MTTFDTSSFLASFSSLTASLQHRITTLSSATSPLLALDSLTGELDALHRSLAGHALFLPPYDRQECSAALAAASKALAQARDELAPR
eukprot:CAMPEP_0184731206 /NCGR_PEP_ID=MMETSP0314-20130426/50168_1 /TAXON_ID=38298 /ORGANISM="Rhodella maculata, Strain CCMP 736" /LENGTH=87 /DNA_ID=CAMNT_0027197537 /DNA_START=131 /DNA_END=390 /DNA_ORIENTATION=-